MGYQNPLKEYDDATPLYYEEKKVTILLILKTYIQQFQAVFFLKLRIFKKKFCVVSFLPSEYEKQKNTYVLLLLFETLLKVFLCHYLKSMKRIPKNEKSPV